jgi:hypothetical protein
MDKRPRTETLLKKHALEEDCLCILALVSDADILIQRSKTRLDKIHGAHAVGGKSNTSARYPMVNQSKGSILDV